MVISSNNFRCDTCPNKSYILDDLSYDELNLVIKNKKDRKFKRGECIMKEGEKIEGFVYLTSGLAKIHKIEFEKSEQIIGISKPFDFIGFLCNFTGGYSKYSYTAIEDATACFIPIKIIKDLIITNGNFSLNLLKNLSKTAEEIIENRFRLNSKHLRGRIAYILLFFANEIYKNDTYNLPISRKEIAELINMTTENVIRIMSEFRQDKIISIDGKTIRILNKEFLEKICNAG